MTEKEIKSRIVEIVSPYVSAYGDDEALANDITPFVINCIDEALAAGAAALHKALSEKKQYQERAERAEQTIKNMTIKLRKLNNSYPEL